MTVSSTGSPTPAEHGDPLKGILLVVVSVSIIPIQDAIAKLLTAHYPIAEIVWGRSASHVLCLLPFILWRHGRAALWPRRAGLHVLRGVFVVSTTYFFFWALSRLPMTDTLALIFCYPLLVTALSPLLLGETVGWRRWAAVIAGLSGVLLIIRPGTDVFQWFSLLGVAAALSYAFYLMITRKTAGSAPPLVAAAYAGLFGVVAMPVLMPGGWVWPTPADAALMASMGIIAAICHILLVKAYDFGPASLLAPFGYAEIVMNVILGFLIFGDFPDPWTWAGAAVVIGAGVYISMRERKIHRRRPL